jgi:hypothetical protein
MGHPERLAAFICGACLCFDLARAERVDKDAAEIAVLFPEAEIVVLKSALLLAC